MKKRLLLLAITLFACTTFTEAQKPLVISEETTRITGPLTKDGHIDFLQALEKWSYPKELATDNNGFRVFVRQFGDAGYDGEPKDREFYRLQKYKKLNLDPNIKPTHTLPPEPQKIISDFYKANVPRDKNWGQPWTLAEYPMLANWVRDIDKPLDAIAEAIRKPVYAFPLLQSPESAAAGKPQNLFETLLPDVQMARTIARHFQTRALYRIRQGNIDGAIDDKLLMHRFGRLIPQKGCIIQVLVGIAIEGMATAIPVGANPQRPLTAQQIRRIINGLDALPPRAPSNDALEWERYMVLSGIQDTSISAAQKKELSEEFKVLSTFLVRPIDWNIVYQQVNEMYDAMQEPPPREKYRVLMEAVEKMPTPLERLTMSPEKIVSKIILALFVPAIDAFEEAIRRMECMENMQRLSLAIQLYRLEHKKLPDANWVKQIEKYLGEKPERYFSCASNPSPKGQTTYALVLGGEQNTIWLVELATPVAFERAIVSVEDAPELLRQSKSHPGGMNVAFNNSAVRFLPSTTNKTELLRMLGRE
jgi:hypothetical protein